MMTEPLVLCNIRPWDVPKGAPPTDVLLRDGIIAAVGSSLDAGGASMWMAGIGSGMEL